MVNEAPALISLSYMPFLAGQLLKQPWPILTGYFAIGGAGTAFAISFSDMLSAEFIDFKRKASQETLEIILASTPFSVEVGYEVFYKHLTNPKSLIPMAVGSALTYLTVSRLRRQEDYTP